MKRKTMNQAESLEEFYTRIHIPQKGIFTSKNGHINIYDRELCKGITHYRRRDFYKISLIEEGGTVHYANKSITLDRPALVFSNPMIPYAWEPASDCPKGYFCIFTEEFVQQEDKNHLIADTPMYKPNGNPVFFITRKQLQFLTGIFQKMQEELDSDYANKQTLLYTYIQIFIHEALKMKPAECYFCQRNASSRISDLFIELLERQFPIEQPGQILQLKTAADYASQLAVHVNYLNRTVKETTGKTTSVFIAERVVNEAKMLLTHTSWNINEIAYSLGFEYPSYFNNFFRRHTNTTPKTFRNEEAVA